MEPYIEERAQLWIGVPNTWPFARSRLAAVVREYGLPLADHLHHWVSLLFNHSPRLGVWPPLHFCDLSSVPSLQTVDGSRLLLSHVSFFLHHLSRVSSSFTASPGPRIVFSLRAYLLGRLLLGAPLPVLSLLCFSLLIRGGLYCGWYGAPRFLWVARSPGVGWTLLFRSLTVPCWALSLLAADISP